MKRPYVPACNLAQRTPKCRRSNWLLSLSLSNPAPPGIVAGLFSQEAGRIADHATILGRQLNMRVRPSMWAHPTANGTYQVSAFMTTGASALSDVVNVAVATGAFRIKRHELNTFYTTLGVGRGLRSGFTEMAIERVGSESSQLTVTLRCVSIVICRVTPSTIIFFPVNPSPQFFQVEGLELGSTVIEATGSGFTTTYPVTVHPFNASLAFFAFPPTVAVGTTLNSYVFLSSPEAVFVQDALQPLDFDLTSDATNIATLSQTRVTVPAGAYRSPDVGVTGIAPGTARLTVSNPAMLAPRVQNLTVTP